MVFKTNNEIYVLSIIQIYSYFSFAFFVLPRKWSCRKYRKRYSYFENHYCHAIIVDKRMNFLFSRYCTLLFSSKENIKFSEVALVYAHCNYLIGFIMFAPGYRPWNTANTTVNIYLLVKNCNKNTYMATFFIYHLIAIRPNLGLKQGGSLTHQRLITALYQDRPKNDEGHRYQVGSQSLVERTLLCHCLKKCTRNNWIMPC